ncbi:hypothetical protein [Methylibium sp.]|uniref:hypothetical protein n=1 Tax=Methylibium sp. TaxID=2067992 RepID=UPI0025FBC6DA|nr:hypothetical protein [Methylibium sp.]
MLDPARARLGLKRSDRSNRITEVFQRTPGGPRERQPAEPISMLGGMVLPSFTGARVFGCEHKESTNFACKVVIVAPVSQPRMKQFHLIGVEMCVNPVAFARMLAKIGLGVAVAQFGIDGFTPLVQAFILGAEHEHGEWVGGYAGDTNPPQPTSDGLHHVTIARKRMLQGDFVIAHICLFAKYGGPTNFVAVGRPC